mgnify:CR=1 FL=1
MLQHTDHLSIWELTHRWYGFDPNSSNEESPPLQVQDTIRLLCKALTNCEITVSNINGILLKNPANALSYEDYLEQQTEPQDHEAEEKSHHIESEDEMSLPTNHSDWNLVDQLAKEYDEEHQPKVEPDFTNDEDGYESYLYRFGRRYWELVDGLDRAYKLRLYEKEKLEAAHIDKANILLFCERYDIQPPEFWFGEDILKKFNAPDSTTKNKGARLQKDIDSFWASLSHKQKARIMTREIAKILWQKNENYKITELEKQEAILEYGMAKHYPGTHTIRNWIKDLKPSNNDV